MLVALIGAAITAFNANDTDDVKRCEIATRFLTSENKGDSTVSEAEWKSLVAFYIKTAKVTCAGDD